MEYNYTAITLAKRDIGETDRLYTLYTREAGKIRAYARGVRKQGARLAASLEDIQFAHVIVARSRGAGNIKSAVVEKLFLAAVKDDLNTLEGILRAIHIFDRLVDMEEKDVHLFDLLKEYLENASLAKSMRDSFFVKFLAHLGHTLQVTHCVSCESKVQQDERIAIDVYAGGVFCSKCLKQAKYPIPFSFNSAKWYHLALHNPLKSLARVNLPDRDHRILKSTLKIQVDSLL